MVKILLGHCRSRKVTQRVQRNARQRVALIPRKCQVALKLMPLRLAVQLRAVVRHEEEVRRAGFGAHPHPAHEERGEVNADRNGAGPAGLRVGNCQRLLLGAVVVEPQPKRFRDAQAGRDLHRDDRLVAPGEERVGRSVAES